MYLIFFIFGSTNAEDRQSIRKKLQDNIIIKSKSTLNPNLLWKYKPTSHLSANTIWNSWIKFSGRHTFHYWNKISTILLIPRLAGNHRACEWIFIFFPYSCSYRECRRPNYDTWEEKDRCRQCFMILVSIIALLTRFCQLFYSFSGYVNTLRLVYAISCLQRRAQTDFGCLILFMNIPSIHERLFLNLCFKNIIYITHNLDTFTY